MIDLKFLLSYLTGGAAFYLIEHIGLTASIASTIAGAVVIGLFGL